MKFKVFDMPGGEVVLQHILTAKEDGISEEEDIYQFMLRYPHQEILCKWLWEHRREYFPEEP